MTVVIALFSRDAIHNSRSACASHLRAKSPLSSASASSPRIRPRVWCNERIDLVRSFAIASSI